MRSANLMIVTLLGLAPCLGVQAQNGLTHVVQANVTQTESLQTASWPQWQGRLALGVTTWQGAGSVSQPQLSGLSLLGDYYFYRSRLDYASALGISGFRATSGVMLGNFSPRLLSGSGAGLIPSGFSISRHALGVGAPLGSFNDDTATAYFGLGYTSTSVRGGWGFSADIGLSAAQGRSRVQLGRNSSALGMGQNLEDVLREMRLAPLLQLGVSYSF